MSIISFAGVALLALLNQPSIGPLVAQTCLSFAGAVLVADALLHLLPHALEGATHTEMTSIGIAGVVGALGLLVVPEVCERHQHQHEAHEHHVQPSGIANLVVEMLHNFVDGIAIGLSFLAGPLPGLNASLAVAAHELPQELGDFVVLRAAGFSVPRLLMWNFLASLTCVGGVALAQLLGQDASAAVQRHLMAFTAGTFLTLALSMIYPQVLENLKAHHQGRSLTKAKTLCLGVSVIAVFILIQVGKLESDHGHSHHDHGHSHHGHEGHAHGEL